LKEDFRVQPLLDFFSNNAHLVVAHTLHLNFQHLTAQLVSGLLVERSALQVQAVELEIASSVGIEQNLLRLLESPLTLSIHTSTIRVRLARIKRSVIESMLNSLVNWAHDSGNVGQQQMDASILSSSPQIPVQFHRTLNIDVCFCFSDLSMAKDKFANEINEIIKV
jgi:hypothetical protein